MTKTQVINSFGGSIREVAKALDISTQAVYAWPEELPQPTADKIRGAMVRLNVKFKGDE